MTQLQHFDPTQAQMERMAKAREEQRKEYERLPLRRWEVLQGSCEDENGITHTASRPDFRSPNAVFESRVDLVGRFGAEKFREITADMTSARGLSSKDLYDMARQAEAREKAEAETRQAGFGPVPSEPELRAMTVEQLKQHAEAEEIELGNARTKDQIVGTILQARQFTTPTEDE